MRSPRVVRLVDNLNSSRLLAAANPEQAPALVEREAEGYLALVAAACPERLLSIAVHPPGTTHPYYLYAYRGRVHEWFSCPASGDTYHLAALLT